MKKFFVLWSSQAVSLFCTAGWLVVLSLALLSKPLMNVENLKAEAVPVVDDGS